MTDSYLYRMACHETISCPRCNAAFECRVGSILRCQCQQVTLTEEERAFINDTYSGCLCAGCLHDMKNAYRQTRFKQRLLKIYFLRLADKKRKATIWHTKNR